jgi:hypothetical protein
VSQTGPHAKEEEKNQNESKKKDVEAPISTTSALKSSQTGPNSKEGEKKRRNGSKKKGKDAHAPEASALKPTEAVAALNSLPGATPLPGEGTTQAIAQLLGLTQDMTLNCTDGSSRSKASSNQRSNKSNTDNTDKHGKEKQQRRTTFSKDVQDIGNAIKLNKKIQGDREKVVKIKAIKRGEVNPQNDANENEIEKKESTGLCTGAKPFVPCGNPEAETAEDQQKQNAKKQDGKKRGGNGKNNKKESKQSSSSSEGKAASGVNLTLQAIQQTKLQKKAATDKHTKRDNSTNDTKPTEEKPRKEDGRKSPTKQNKAVDQAPSKKTTKPQEDRGKKKEKSNLKAKTNAATADAPSTLSPAIPPNQPQTTNDLNYGSGRPIVVVHIAEKPSIAQVSLLLVCRNINMLTLCILTYIQLILLFSTGNCSRLERRRIHQISR